MNNISFMKSLIISCVPVVLVGLAGGRAQHIQAAERKLSVLIVDGRNNHNWQITTDALRATLEATGRFIVSSTTAPASTIPRAPRAPKSVHPRVQAAFEKYAQAYQKQTQPAKDPLGPRRQT